MSRQVEGKILVWHDTPRNTWLSLEEYRIPHFVTDYFEDIDCLVKNVEENAEWYKVGIPFEPPQGFVWEFLDDYEDKVPVTHFMLIGE